MPPAEAEPAPPPAAPKSPPYSLPFQLRPVMASSAVRSDTSVALYEDPTSGASASTVASILTASYKVTPELAPLVRIGIVSNSPPKGDSGFGVTNPVVGATYGVKLGSSFKLGLFLGLTIPVGSGGGNSPDAAKKAANAAGIAARSGMDNALFAVNDFTVFPGVDFAYVSGGLTAQVEATLFQLSRVRGDQAQADSSRTNFTAGVHVGYFFLPVLSAGVELRHQRWLSTPKAVEANDSLRDTTTIALGPRFHFQVGDGLWLRPGVSFAVPLDDPLKKSSYKTFQIDVPFVF